MRIVEYKIGPWLGRSELTAELPATGMLWWKKPARRVTFVGRNVDWVGHEDGSVVTLREIFGDGAERHIAALELCEAWECMVTDKPY
jgi:hypothetical protein